MGLKRPILQALAGAALLSSAASAIAQQREPLAITALKDPDAMLRPSSVSLDGGVSAPDDGIESFARAINEALRLQKQATEATCRSQERGIGTVVTRSAWEAHCRYQRY